jgi:molybdopterin-guanine dinucleotide biosynthesis protein A
MPPDRSTTPAGTQPGARPAPDRHLVTGVVLAGGEGRRMGGLDKGLQPLHGQPLAARALARLAPQVAGLMLSANRHLAQYAAWGHPVWPDEWPTGLQANPGEHLGPLAGLWTALQHCPTPWLVAVPCDLPDLPADLVARLCAAAGPDHLAVQAATRAAAGPPRTEGLGGDETDAATLRLHPACCLLHRSAAPVLADYLCRGGRRLREGLALLPLATAVFPDEAAFTNTNTLVDLANRAAAGAGHRSGPASTG